MTFTKTNIGNHLKGLDQTDKRSPAANSRFAKAGVSCFYDSEVLNSSFMHLMKFSAENPRLRKAAKRYKPFLGTVQTINRQ